MSGMGDRDGLNLRVWKSSIGDSHRLYLFEIHIILCSTHEPPTLHSPHPSHLLLKAPNHSTLR